MPPTTVVTITVDGTTYRHQAYALGMDAENDPARAALAEFVAADDRPARRPSATPSSATEEPFVAEQYLIQAHAGRSGDARRRRRADDRAVAGGRAGAPRRRARRCAVVPADGVAPLFADATTLTFFTEPDGRTAPTSHTPCRRCHSSPAAPAEIVAASPPVVRVRRATAPMVTSRVGAGGVHPQRPRAAAAARRRRGRHAAGAEGAEPGRPARVHAGNVVSSDVLIDGSGRI